MSETPKDLFPPLSERAIKTAEALRKALTEAERADLETALRYAKEDTPLTPESDPSDPFDWLVFPDFSEK